MNLYNEKKKYVEKKLAQITVFQVVLILSLPSYAQIVKKYEPNQVFTWIGFSVIIVGIIMAKFYKQQLKQDLVKVKTNDHLDPQNKTQKSA